MSKLLRCLFGLNAAGLIRGLRLGPREFVNGCLESLSAAHPFQDRAAHRVQRLLKAIPEISLGEILGNRKVTIHLDVQNYENGMLPSNEAMALLSILAAEKPNEVLEIGTFMGHTTKAMAENLPQSMIHTADLPPDFSLNTDPISKLQKDDFHLIKRRVVGREFKNQPVESRIQQHFGDTAEADFTKFGHPSFFFIDGSHTYEYCKQDSEKCYALCGGAGTFLWHDCDAAHPGVLKFISEWISLGRNIVRIQGTAIAYWKSK